MKKNYLATLKLAVATSAVLAAPMLAQAEEGQFYIAPGLQWMNFDNDRGLEEDTGLAVGLGYDFTDNISGEINIFDMDLDGLVNNNEYRQYRADVFYTFDHMIGKFSPFVVGGVGNNDFDFDNETFANIGVGFKYKISESLEWRTAYRKFYEQHDDYVDSGIDSSLVYRFGAKKSMAETPVSEAPMAMTDPDTDGDGVPDSRDKCADTPRTHRVDADGCSIPIDEIARIELHVNFDFDKADVKSQYLSEIRQVADYLNANPGTSATLEGHTDSRGSAEYNQRLSQRRVDAVKAVLVDQMNVSASRVSAVGYGESRPVASNETDAGRAENRRVESVITYTVQRFEQR
ncbi:MAG: OmpA family protein [Pseudohongiellaceae bacterium]|nr:OmpA family protein [Pseudohongiellaceae bacterium]